MIFKLYSKRQIKGNDVFYAIALSNISELFPFISSVCKLTHLLWSCQAVIEGFVFIWILITLSCQSVTILFLVQVPGSLFLGNDIGTEKSPEADIPPVKELKNCKLQIYRSQFSFLFPPYLDLLSDMLIFVPCGHP